jgi:hypothetical protein
LTPTTLERRKRESTPTYWPSAREVTMRGESTVLATKMEERAGLVEDLAVASVAAKKEAEADSEVIAVVTEEAEPMRALPGLEAKTFSPKKISLLCSNEQS